MRLPDFFSRTHAAGVTDTLAAPLLLLGVALQLGWSLDTLKILLVLAFILATNPTASHAMAKAALHGGRRPKVGDELTFASRAEQEALMDALIDIALLAFLVLVTIAAIRLTDLFAVAMLFGIYSFLTAGLFVVLDAVDVAFTEAAVGAGISTVLMLATLAPNRAPRAAARPHRPVPPLVVVVVTGAALVYGTLRHAAAWATGQRRSTSTWRRATSQSRRDGDRRAEHGHLGAGQLPRLRHAGRDDGDLHRRDRRAAA